jgi:hypothetical protein
MIIDYSNTFADGQSLIKDITELATGDSTILDLVKAGGMYKEGFLFIRIGDAQVGATSKTLFELRTSSDNFNSIDVLLWSSGAIGVADLTKDTIIAKVPMPLGILRYLKVKFTVSVVDTTGGTFDAMIVPSVNEGF